MPFLQFKGRTAVESYHYSLPHHALELDAALSVLPDGQVPSLQGNIIIEGDNLVALKALLPTHAGRVKCIYIDPPYNTGEEAWVYNDNLNQPQFKEWIGATVGKEGDDAARHDKWCCMMYPRLMLLRDLLRDDGVIFVSLDDNEIGSLRVLMDEVFGSDNFIASIVWQKRTSPDARMPLGAAHDYIVGYAKTHLHRINPLAFNKDAAHEFKNPDGDPRGPWASTDLTGQTGHATASQYYEITTPGGAKYRPPDGRCWALAEATFLKLSEEDRIWYGKTGDARPRLKRFLSDVDGSSTWTWWPNTEVGHNQEATQDLSSVLGRVGAFDNPKPVRLIKRIIQLATDENDIVLDSFAGSGTTGHAVLQLNREADSGRQFILVQQPYEPKGIGSTQQPNICREITSERIRRVINGYPFAGSKAEILLEERIGLNTLKKCSDLLERIEQAKQDGKARFDEVRSEMKDGVVRVEGIRKVTDKTEGIPGTFTYARVSDRPLLGDYRDFGEHLPPYEELAKYIYYTETSRDWDTSAMNVDTGKIGENGKASYYLLYTPDNAADRKLDLDFLNTVAAADPNRDIVVYHEKFWMHSEQLHNWEKEHGKHVRSMHIPFQMR